MAQRCGTCEPIGYRRPAATAPGAPGLDPPSEAPPIIEPTSDRADAGPLGAILSAVGLAYLGLGVVVLAAVLFADVRSVLFPTGWLFPAVLIVTGALMAVRRRFDIVGVLWGGLWLAVFLLDMDTHLAGIEVRFDDPAAFDSSIIVAVFGLVALALRPWFRR